MEPTVTLPSYLIPLLDLFASHGERAYPVGGCVRDTLRGVRPHDWDVAVTTPPEITQAICAAAGYRVIPTGLKHGTVTILAPRSGNPSDHAGDYSPIECTTCRTEGGYTDGRHPDAVSFTGCIEDDLSRRDFTVNAMAFDRTENGQITVIDLFGGQADLAAGVIRCVGDPATRFAEDALRLLRAVRFTVQLGFSLDAHTYNSMRGHKDGIARISRERVSEEFQKILCSPNPAGGLKALEGCGLLRQVLPAGCRGCEMGHPEELPPEFSLRMAWLLWRQGAAEVAENLASLRLPNTTRDAITRLVDSSRISRTRLDPTPCGARMWRHDWGELAVPALLVRLAVSDECLYKPDIERNLLEHVRRSEALGEPVTIAELAINGRDLISLGYRPGPALKDTLAALLETVWQDPAQNTRVHLLAAAQARLAQARRN